MADSAMERRFDLVAHQTQKHRLCAVGTFCLGHGGLEFVFGGNALVHINQPDQQHVAAAPAGLGAHHAEMAGTMLIKGQTGLGKIAVAFAHARVEGDFFAVFIQTQHTFCHGIFQQDALRCGVKNGDANRQSINNGAIELLHFHEAGSA